MKVEVWLGLDCKAIINEKKQTRILITNPKDFRGVTASDIWIRLPSTCGKNEFESWISDEITDAVSEALRNRKNYADISKLSGATLYIRDYTDSNWIEFKSNEEFKTNLISLPIFEIVKETKEEVLLKYVTK